MKFHYKNKHLSFTSTQTQTEQIMKLLLSLFATALLVVNSVHADEVSETIIENTYV